MAPTPTAPGAPFEPSPRGEDRPLPLSLVRNAALPQAAAKPRYEGGWRNGKPAEDPAKLKSWGIISAKPSEFLVRMRGGEILSAGQGASCFKWPWESVAILPTSIQRLHFTADQVTREKVGVQVTGIAVYRIAEPLIAFRMLNFSFPERASEKLEEMLGEMFTGASRRLVANLTVEECLQRRKEGLAQELMREIAPVVSGQGRAEDRTHQGWGVILDSIEIQDVRVLSPAVFANLQARYRHEQERLAKAAELEKLRAIRLDEAQSSRQIELSRLAAAAEVRHQKQQTQEQAELEALSSQARVQEARAAQERQTQEAQLRAQRELALARLEAELELRRRRMAADEQAKLDELSSRARLAEAEANNERQAQVSRAQVELERAQLSAQAEEARHAQALAEAAREAELLAAKLRAGEARRALAEVELSTHALELERQEKQQALALGLARARKDIENTLTPEVIQLTLAQKLPELAQAFRQNMGQVHVTAVDGANPFGFVAAAVEGVLGLARSAGLELPDKGKRADG